MHVNYPIKSRIAIIAPYTMAKDSKKRKNSEDMQEKQSILSLSQETINSIWGVSTTGLAFFLVLSFMGFAGIAGEYTNIATEMTLGWGMFVLPLIAVLLSVAFFKSIHSNVTKSALIGALLLFLSILAMLHVSALDDSILKAERAGYLGYVLGYPLFALTGPIASIVILIFIGIISFLISLNIPINVLWTKKKKEESIDGAQEVAVLEGGQILKSEEIKQSAQTQSTKDVSEKPAKPQEKTVAEKAKDIINRATRNTEWKLPPLSLLNAENEKPKSGDINANVGIIKKTLSNFGIDVEMGEVSIGPAVTQYTLRPAIGVKLSKIVALQQDLSLALAAHPIRIEAPIPGKALVGIEIPNKKAAVVRLREMLESEEYKDSKSLLPLAFGRDVAGLPVVVGLEKMPHALIAGATGTGKSVSLNSVILSLLYKHSPDVLKLILVDPKRVELSLYNGIPHLITPVIVDTKKVLNALKWAVREMEQRYQKLAECGARDIFSFNEKQTSSGKDILPFIVIIIDELADLMAQHGKDVEGAIVRLAQMARAVGIHLIVSTQRPSVEVITGLIKANITTRVALQVASQIDSRTILDTSGAEKLLGKGDMLLQSGDMGAKMRRIQCAFVTEQEVHDVVLFIKNQARGLDIDSSDAEAEDVTASSDNSTRGAVARVLGSTDPTAESDEDMGDELFNEAKDVVVQAGKASASLLQRRLRVGYARAARLMDILEEQGIIGPGDGARPREVYGSNSSRDMSDDKYRDDGTTAQSV